MKSMDCAGSTLAQEAPRVGAGRRRWGGREWRVVLALLLGAACAMAWPGAVMADGDDGIDWEMVCNTDSREWPSELHAQLIAAGYSPEAVVARVRQGLDPQGEGPVEGDGAGPSPEEAAGRRDVAREEAREGGEAAASLEAIAARIRAAVQRGDLTPEEGRARMAAARERLASNAEGGSNDDEALTMPADEADTAVEGRSWGEVKAEAAQAE